MCFHQSLFRFNLSITLSKEISSFNCKSQTKVIVNLLSYLFTSLWKITRNWKKIKLLFNCFFRFYFNRVSFWHSIHRFRKVILFSSVLRQKWAYRWHRLASQMRELLVQRRETIKRNHQRNVVWLRFRWHDTGLAWHSLLSLQPGNGPYKLHTIDWRWAARTGVIRTSWLLLRHY